MIVEVDGRTFDTDEVKIISGTGIVLEVDDEVILAYQADASPSDGKRHKVCELA